MPATLTKEHPLLANALVLILDRLLPVLTAAADLSKTESWKEAFPARGAFRPWFCGVLYGATAQFGRAESEEVDADDLRGNYALLCRLIDELYEEYDGDMDKMAQACLPPGA